MADNADAFLEHYGIKGMRWGKRKASVETAKADDDAPTAKPSADAQAVSTYKSKVASGGVDALSTKELQQLVNRQNLEQQYAKLNPEPISAGQKFMTETLPTVLNVAKTGHEAYRVFYPAKEPPPPSTDLRMVSGKQKAGDMALHLGKSLLKEHGLTVGKMALEAIMSK
ncbi:hypothetical protein PBI_SHEPARD_6 [Arthrobacter phage Shepard]|nr:hypothetical protein PBI_SHEPARD_6 [Arthrobacter phage Shepard]